MRYTLPGQLDLPDTAEDRGETLRRKAQAPLLPNKPQEPCDLGLFSDNAKQIDIEDHLLK